MFCRKCGKQLPDGSRFCSGCGTATAGDLPVTPAPQSVAVQPAPVSQPSSEPQPVFAASEPQPVYTEPAPVASVPQQSVQYPPYQPAASVQSGAGQPVASRVSTIFKNKKLLALILAGCAVIVLVLFLMNGGSGVNRSAESAAAAAVEASMSYDADLMLECAHISMVRQLADDLDMPSNSSRAEIAKALKKRMVGREEYKVTVTIGSATLVDTMTLAQSEIDREDYDMTWQEYNAIDAVAVVEVVAEARYKDGDGNSWTDDSVMEVLCLKVDGKWYVLDVD